MERTIFHVDMNSCYASIECLYHPELQGRPVAVGGSTAARHGIILAKNEAAKACGVCTAEALWQARQKCPDLVILPPRFGLYTRFSRLARQIYYQYTDRVEPFGLDEAWLDVTDPSLSHWAAAEALAHRLREQVKAELGITVSIGVSFNKVFAKLGSDYKKPDAVTVFSPHNFRQLVWPLPVGNLLYVGRATQKKLALWGIDTIGALAHTDPALLSRAFGKWGAILHDFANGRDNAPVSIAGAKAPMKSMGHSLTAPRDLENETDAALVLYPLAESVAQRLREGGFLANTVVLILRDNTLRHWERQLHLPLPTCLASELHAAAMDLLHTHYAWPRPLRSIGVRAAQLELAAGPRQLSLLENSAARDKEERLERMVDDLRQRFGPRAVLRSALLLDPALTEKPPQAESVLPLPGFFA